MKADPARAYPTKVWENINTRYSELSGVKVCIPSSGDNIVLYGFCLLGANVTSCDISEQQIKNARHIGNSEGWSIDFIVLKSSFNIDS